MIHNKKNCLLYLPANHTDTVIKNIKTVNLDTFNIINIEPSSIDGYRKKYNRIFFLFQLGTPKEFDLFEKQKNLFLNSGKTSLIVIIPFNFEKEVNTKKAYELTAKMQKYFLSVAIFDLSQRLTNPNITLNEFYNRLLDDFTKHLNI